MAAYLHEREDGSDYTVFSTFWGRTSRQQVNVTYQITGRGLDAIETAGVKDGDEIPSALFWALKNNGDLYTGAGHTAPRLAMH